MFKLCSCLIFIIISFNLLLRWADCNGDVENTASNATYRSHRLPNTTFPIHYHLHITTNIHKDEFDFHGNATIDIFVKNSTNQIILNAKNLKNFIIKIYKLKNHKSSPLLKNITYTNDVLSNYLIISTCMNCTPFKRGLKYRLEILYDGEMHENFGIYSLAYTDHRNQTIYHAATHFEPTGAQLALPCYDEPVFKANFSLRITHGSIYNAISNMGIREIRKHEDEEEIVTTIFYTTPRMSTYLLAFVISNFKYITNNYRGLIQRFYTSPNSMFKGEKQLLAYASLIVATLEDYLGIYYPLAKLDHVILNKTYGVAMENWGLITYKESSLQPENEADPQHMIRNFLVLGHEISHQWFGNLVSPQWWSYIWLNEGFATYFSYIITDMLKPEFEIMNLFVTDMRHSLSINEYNKHLEPMTFYVEKDTDIMARFNSVVYHKATCVIRMFHHAFEWETFLIAIKKFLRKFQYSTANEMDLFDCIQDEYKRNTHFNRYPWSNSVKDIMLSWTHSNWIPIIKIFRNYANDTITIRQHRQRDENLENFQNSTQLSYLWIPMNFASASHNDFNSTWADYFMPPIEEVTININKLNIRLESNDWLLVNKQQTGLYYVIYEDENLMKIAKSLELNHSHIHHLNRANIFQGLQMQLDNDDIESFTTVLELLQYLRKEQSYTVWYFAVTILKHLERSLRETVYHALCKQFIQSLLSETYHRLFDNNHDMVFEGVMESLVGPCILSIACDVELPDCLKLTANKTFEYIFQDENFEIENRKYNDFTPSFLCKGLRQISNDEFKAILNVLSKPPKSSLDYDDVVHALCCMENIDNINAYLDILINKNSTFTIVGMYSDNFINILYLYKKNSVARPIVWNFINHHYKYLSAFPEFLDVFKHLAEYVPSYQHNQFRNLYHKLLMEVKSNADTNGVKQLLDFDTAVIGRKVHKIELFVSKFGNSIYDWLRRHEESSLARNSVSSKHATVFRLIANFFAKLLFC